MNTDKIDKACEELVRGENDKIRIYFHPLKDKFWKEDSRGIFVPYNSSAISRILQHEHGIPKEGISKKLAEIQTHDVVDFATKIGGWRKGLHELEGMNVLVPSEQKRIKLIGGECKTLNEFLIGMFGQEQFEWYCGWLRHWLDGFYSFTHTPGQVLVLIGPPSCGKTLLIELHNHIFGGGGKPLKYMTGQTNFNGELCQYCHLYLDDEFQDLGPRGKKALKSMCKQIAVGRMQRFEFKHQTAFNASPQARVVLACNEDKDSLSVVPELDENIKNKISLLHCKKKDMPMPARTGEERETFWKCLVEEIPAFLHFVIKGFEVPKKFNDDVDGRMGVKAYQHPKATELAENCSMDGQRMEEIIEILRGQGKLDQTKTWRGNATDLLKILQRGEIEEYTTTGGLGRFLKSRTHLPASRVQLVGHRTYRIDCGEADD
jgi:hypothetical protein